MKNNLKIIIVFVLIISINSIYAQNFNTFSTSLIKGDLSGIASQLDDKVEVSILNDDSYTKSEAESLIANFFTVGATNEYKAIHKGSAIDNAFYQIGELKANNKTYRTYMYSKKTNGDYRIQEFRIEN
jgi:hypothetical protein